MTTGWLIQPGVYYSALTEREFERLCQEARKLLESPDFRPLSLVEIRREIKSLRIQEARDYWTADMDSKLGTATDEVIGQVLGKPGPTVADRRRALGIPAFEQRWTADEDAVLFTASCKVIAKRLGRTLDGVKHRRRLLKRKEAHGSHAR